MGNDNIEIRLAVEEDRKRWDDYVLAHPKGLAYQLFAWKDAVNSAYGFKGHYFFAMDNDLIKGIFPLIRTHLPLLKGEWVSLPYCDAGGILADSREIEMSLLLKALESARDLEISRIEIRSSKPIGNIPPESTAHKEKVRMILPLPNNSEELLEGFKSKLRSQVLKPTKDGLKTKVGRVELVDEFYSVFVENMRDLGSPVHSKKWFLSLLEAYCERAICVMVHMPDGEPAAGGLILCHGKTVSIPWASSLRRMNRWNPNMLLYWTFLEYASNEGYEYFDFGRSTVGEGTYKFKEQWGAQPNALHWARFSTSNISKKTHNQSREPITTPWAAVEKLPRP